MQIFSCNTIITTTTNAQGDKLKIIAAYAAHQWRKEDNNSARYFSYLQSVPHNLTIFNTESADKAFQYSKFCTQNCISSKFPVWFKQWSKPVTK